MFPVFFSLQQLNYPRKISKSKIVIRGTKARPPQGSLRRVVTPVQKRASLTVSFVESFFFWKEYCCSRVLVHNKTCYFVRFCITFHWHASPPNFAVTFPPQDITGPSALLKILELGEQRSPSKPPVVLLLFRVNLFCHTV